MKDVCLGKMEDVGSLDIFSCVPDVKRKSPVRLNESEPLDV